MARFTTDNWDLACARREMLEESLQQDDRAVAEEIGFAVHYLVRFGYLPYKIKEDHDIPVETLKAGLKDFQRVYGLSQDGVVGSKTIRAMEQPRCGIPDKLDKNNPDHKHAIKMMRLAKASKKKWQKDGLHYYVKSYVRDIPEAVQDDIFEGAWDAWDIVCGLRIMRTTSARDADLVVDTGEGRRSNFDGQGGVLAWAYMPQGKEMQLRMKFDLGETWVDQPNKRGVLLFNVACHEFGHMLGLEHSDREDALMAPHYNPCIDTPPWDDIEKIQRLSGKNGLAKQMMRGEPKRFSVVCTDLQVQGFSLTPDGGGEHR